MREVSSCFGKSLYFGQPFLQLSKISSLILYHEIFLPYISRHTTYKFSDPNPHRYFRLDPHAQKRNLDPQYCFFVFPICIYYIWNFRIRNTAFCWCLRHVYISLETLRSATQLFASSICAYLLWNFLYRASFLFSIIF